ILQFCLLLAGKPRPCPSQREILPRRKRKKLQRERERERERERDRESCSKKEAWELLHES
ncbi:unnamed protein product, partial [Musa textilis]